MASELGGDVRSAIVRYGDVARMDQTLELVGPIGPGDRDEQGKRIPMDVDVGYTVLFARYSGTEIKVDGKKLLILRENDLLAIVE